MNQCVAAWPSIRVFCFCALALFSFEAACDAQSTIALPLWPPPLEKLHGVLSRQQLTPPLRSASVTLSYSHDGQYLLWQDSSGIYVLSRQPLKMLGYIDAPYSYPARFSADSQSLIAVSFSLSYERWAVRDARRLESKELPIPDGCVDAQLSPDGALLACYRPDGNLGVLQLSTGQWIFSALLHSSDPHLTVVPVSLDLNTPFAGPFGFRLSHDMNPLANRAIYKLPMVFSPDDKTLVAGDLRDAVRVDLAERKKINFPGALQKYLAGAFAIQNDARVLVIPRGKPGEPALRSLNDGSVLATPNFKADSAHFGSDTRYLLLHDAAMRGAQIFDLENNRAVETPDNIGIDVQGGELAIAADHGGLSLYRLGERLPFASVILPLQGMLVLRSASVSPSLDKLAISIDGVGGLFQIANGQRVSSYQHVSAVNFADRGAAFLLMAGNSSTPSPPLEYAIDRVQVQGAVHARPQNKEATLAPAPQTILRLDTTTAKASSVWEGGKNLLRGGGSVFFEYSFESAEGRGLLFPQIAINPWGLFDAGAVPYILRALDPPTGKALWSRTFSGLPPVPFADPQGQRLVLSWKAKSPGALAAAKHLPAAGDVLKKAKLTDKDSFLEVVDAQTGKPVGGLLVQSGIGPADFESIFSVGEAIIFLRDGVRVQLYSMLDGQLKAKLLGVRPSANAQSNLLALQTGPQLLAIYDLNTAAKLDEQIFSDPIIYTHFSEDGQRLLVLTQNQCAFVLDMKSIRHAQSSASTVKAP